MSKQALKNAKLFTSLVAGLLLCVLVAVPAVLTSAQSKKEGQAKVEKKKPTMRDAVTRKSASDIEPRPGFEIVLKGDNGFTVRRSDTKEIIGSAHCGVCPGGNCKARIFGSGGGCRGCGDSNGRSCTVDPF
jgi:hypothetical protein